MTVVVRGAAGNIGPNDPVPDIWSHFDFLDSADTATPLALITVAPVPDGFFAVPTTISTWNETVKAKWSLKSED